VYVHVNIDPTEVLEDMDDDQLREELTRREKKIFNAQHVEDERYLLEQIWLHYRGQDVPYCLREYVWRVLGKVI
jgi:hypothetical protein